MKFDHKTYRLADGGNFTRITLAIGVVGIALSIIGYFIDSQQLIHSYLIAFVFWVSIGLGAIFFVMIQHLTSATWSIVLRRLAENIMVILPFMAIMAIPLLIGIKELYQWSHYDIVEADHLLQSKSVYLNTKFFILRMAGYFVIWYLLTRYLYKTSLNQDSGHKAGHIARMRKISAPGMILFAFTLTFASFDWLMSLEGHWYSTIFGVYIFAGSVLGFLGFLILIVMYLKSKRILYKEITVEHYHDLGKLTFTFIILWGYMAFSQYFLIWYGNIPEETFWFLHRWEGSWKTVTLMIVFGHFCIPFFILFPRGTKRNRGVLTVIAIWILAMHWLDLYWLVMPSLHPDGVHLSWMDLTTMLGTGGVFVWLFWRRMIAQPLVPIKDPGLDRSIQFVNS